jgi:uncharacterized membrane protein
VNIVVQCIAARNREREGRLHQDGAKGAGGRRGVRSGVSVIVSSVIGLLFSIGVVILQVYARGSGSS